MHVHASVTYMYMYHKDLLKEKLLKNNPLKEHALN